MARNDNNNGQGDLLEKLVTVNRVAKVVTGGRQSGLTALTVVVDGDGSVCFVYVKVSAVLPATQQALAHASEMTVTVPFTSVTLLHPIQCRSSPTRLQ